MFACSWGSALLVWYIIGSLRFAYENGRPPVGFETLEGMEPISAPPVIAVAPFAVGTAVAFFLKAANDAPSGLAERGVQVRSVDAENAKPGMPLVMTMHRAKGLEFTHVLLFGVHEGSVPFGVKEHAASEADLADALLRERSLLYVAATRARDVLAVSWSGEKSSLLR